MDEKRSQAMRIFVSAHKPVDLFNSAVLQPVQVGCSMRNDLFPWAWHDNDGENISDQNAMYCELTAQYWAWKNVDAEYYASAIIAATLISLLIGTRKTIGARSLNRCPLGLQRKESIRLTMSL